MNPDWRWGFPVKNGDIPASYVSLTQGNSLNNCVFLPKALVKTPLAPSQVKDFHRGLKASAQVVRTRFWNVTKKYLWTEVTYNTSCGGVSYVNFVYNALIPGYPWSLVVTDNLWVSEITIQKRSQRIPRSLFMLFGDLCVSFVYHRFLGWESRWTTRFHKWLWMFRIFWLQCINNAHTNRMILKSRKAQTLNWLQWLAFSGTS